MGCCSSGESNAANYKIWLNSEFEFSGWIWTNEHDEALTDQFQFYIVEDCMPFIDIIKSYFSAFPEGNYKSYFHSSISPLGGNYQPFPSQELIPSEYRINVMGSPGVGKSAIVTRCTTGYNEWDDMHFHSAILNVGKSVFDAFGAIERSDREMQKVQLDMYEAPGDLEELEMERHVNVIVIEAHMTLLVFSVVDRESFKFVKKWRDEIITLRQDERAPIVVVCNKWDLIEDGAHDQNMENYVDLNEMYQWVIENKLPFIETSATKNINANTLLRQSIYEHHLSVIRENHATH